MPTDLESYSDGEKALAVRHHNQREARGRVVFSGEAAVAAEAAKTILGHERLIRGHSVREAAHRCGLSETKYLGAEDGWVSSGALSSTEKAALTRYGLGASVETLLSDNTPDNRAKLAGRF